MYILYKIKATSVIKIYASSLNFNKYLKGD